MSFKCTVVSSFEHEFKEFKSRGEEGGGVRDVLTLLVLNYHIGTQDFNMSSKFPKSKNIFMCYVRIVRKIADIADMGLVAKSTRRSLKIQR